MQNKTSKNIPREILDGVKKRYLADMADWPEYSLTERSLYPAIKNVLNRFIKDNARKNALLRDAATKFGNGLSSRTVYRAFRPECVIDGVAMGGTGTPEVRNVLCLYRSHLERGWNATIEAEFQSLPKQYLDSQDSNETRVTIHATDLQRKDYLTAINKKMDETRRILSDPEREVFDDKRREQEFEQPSHPSEPEFPPPPFYTPRFPASETYQVAVPDFADVWLKDESTNPTGSHKDRMGFEITRFAQTRRIPEMSLISSGSAAISIQHFFNLYEVDTRLKVLVHDQIDEGIKTAIRNLGAEVIEHDLMRKSLKSRDIKKITGNSNGIDITYRDVMDPNRLEYFDWMSFEVLNEEPDYCLVPVGTGDLLTNILRTLLREKMRKSVTRGY